MASCNCSGFIFVVLCIFLSLCSCQALGDTDKFRNVNKRIFCNMAGCGNMVHGKRNFMREQLYNMFNRPSAGKRSQAPQYGPSAYQSEVKPEETDLPYTDWSAETYDDTVDTNLSPSFDGDESNDVYPKVEDRFYVPNNGLDREGIKLREKIRLMRAAEDLLDYVNSVARRKAQRLENARQHLEDYNMPDWRVRRK